jgi:hypothetical protein
MKAGVDQYVTRMLGVNFHRGGADVSILLIIIGSCWILWLSARTHSD